MSALYFSDGNLYKIRIIDLNNYSMKSKRKKVLNQALGAALPIVATVFFWVYWQKEHKSLTILLENNTSIVSLGENKIGHLELYYKSKLIKSLSVVDVSIINDGNSPIKKDDFFESLQINFAAELAADVVVLDKNPDQLNPKLVIKGDCVELVPLLMNQNDYIKFRCYIINQNGDSDKFTVVGRVVGVQDLKLIEKKPRRIKYIVILSAAILSTIASLCGIIIVVRNIFPVKRVKKTKPFS